MIEDPKGKKYGGIYSPLHSRETGHSNSLSCRSKSTRPSRVNSTATANYNLTILETGDEKPK